MTVQDRELDTAAVEAFANRLVGVYADAMTTAMITLGHKTGLFEAAVAGPATSSELAARAGLDERYVREWLGSMTTADIFEYEADTRTFALPVEHAALLTGNSSTNLAGQAPLVTYLNTFVDPVADAFRNGGGVTYDAYRPGFTAVMDEINRRLYDEALVATYLPLAPGLTERLESGARVADIGTGAGHPLNLLARAFPASTFVGFDLARDAIAAAGAEAAAYGLRNVRFEERDVATIDEVAAYDVVFAFDAIHDQADPARVLSNVRRSLADDGTFVMVDIKASSHLEDNRGNPVAPLIYGISVLHCMTVSLAYGGAGLGTAWGEQLACEMLKEAGFTSVAVNEVPQDPFNLVYVCRP
jgi:2-polyprenyl-3-methyl-5-hydroxy-6-metoxy-1,4-benzoquinol methylase